MNVLNELPNIETVVRHLQQSITLCEMLTRYPLKANADHVNSKAAIDALSANLKQCGDAYNVIINYRLISQTVEILEQRIEQAAAALDAILEKGGGDFVG